MASERVLGMVFAAGGVSSAIGAISVDRVTAAIGVGWTICLGLRVTLTVAGGVALLGAAIVALSPLRRVGSLGELSRA